MVRELFRSREKSEGDNIERKLGNFARTSDILSGTWGKEEQSISQRVAYPVAVVSWKKNPNKHTSSL